MVRSGVSGLSQETLAIIGVGVVLAALILTSTAGMRSEFQAEFRAVRAEFQAVRAEARADREALRAEARADRQAFQEQILRLTEQHGVLNARVDGLRAPPAPNP